MHDAPGRVPKEHFDPRTGQLVRVGSSDRYNPNDSGQKSNRVRAGDEAHKARYQEKGHSSWGWKRDDSRFSDRR